MPTKYSIDIKHCGESWRALTCDYRISSINLIGNFNAKNNQLVSRPFSLQALMISLFNLILDKKPLSLKPPERIVIVTLSRNDQDILWLINNLASISKSAAIL